MVKHVPVKPTVDEHELPDPSSLLSKSVPPKSIVLAGQCKSFKSERWCFKYQAMILSPTQRFPILALHLSSVTLYICPYNKDM